MTVAGRRPGKPRTTIFHDRAERRQRRASTLRAVAFDCLEGRALQAGIAVYPINAGTSAPLEIAQGPDGAMWFTENNVNAIGRISPTGVVTSYTVPTNSSQPWGITQGPDGALWFTENNANKIGRLTTSGVFTEYTIPTPLSQPRGICVGPDNNLWFTENKTGQIGRITVGGAITDFPTSSPLTQPFDICAGPDHALWFTEKNTGTIGRMTISGALTEYSTSANNTQPAGITLGPDNALWFTENNTGMIGRITTGGTLKEYPTSAGNTQPFEITAGADGALWFTENNTGAIGRMTTSGVLTAEYPTLTNDTKPAGIALGPDGGLWFTENNKGLIGRLAVITVDTMADTVDGNTTSLAALLASKGIDGRVSLREAILASNNTPGLNTITFGIASGAATIRLTSSLPPITNPVFLDGTTQPGYTGAPLIELTGILAGAGANGLTITAGSSTVTGLAINGFNGDGILVTTNGGNLIEGDFIGTSHEGTSAIPNTGYGIDLGSAASNTIGGTTAGAGNLISGNTLGGIRVFGDSYIVSEDFAEVRIDAATGTVLATYPVPSVYDDSAVIGPDGSLYVPDYDNNLILHFDATGRALPSFGSGQLDEPQDMIFGPDGNLYVGDATGDIQKFTPSGVSLGTFASGNGLSNAKGMTFGPDGALYVADFDSSQVFRYDSSGNQTTFVKSTNNGGLSGPEDLQFGPDGYLYVTSYSNNKVIRYDGTTGAPAGTFLSGGSLNSPYGLRFDASGNLNVACRGSNSIVTYSPTGVLLHTLISGLSSPAWFSLAPGNGTGDLIQGNVLGLNANLTSPLANGKDGVDVYASNITIGGTAPGAGNTIADNSGKGVVSAAGTGDAIEGNSIFANGGLGIDLGNNGATANTGVKNASLPNSGMNYPVFTSANLSGNTLTVAGYVGTAAGQSAFAGARVEVFKSDSAAGSHGAGQTYLGYVTADGSGNFSGSLAVSGLTTSNTVTGTATDTSGSTSEFSLNVNVASALASTTTLASSLNPSVYGQSVTFTATVSGTSGAATGTATFLEGSTVLATAALVGGVATFVTSALGAGTHYLNVQYGGSGVYAASTSAVLTQTVKAAALTVKADSPTKVYGGPLPALTYTASGFANGDTAASVLAGALTTSATAASGVNNNYGITQGSLSSNNNYTINYTAGTLAITPAALTVTANSATKVYGAPLPALTYTASGFVNGDSAASVLAGALTTSATAASGVNNNYGIAQGSLSSNNNYTINYTAGTLAITPAALTVTANSPTKVYGAPLPALTYTASGFVNGDSAASVLTGSLTTSATAASGVNNNYGIAQGSLLSNNNYTIIYTAGTLAITPAALTVTANSATKVYGAPLPALTYTASGFVNGDSAASVLSGSLTTSATAASGVNNNYGITQGSLLSNNNYTIIYTAGTLAITPAALTVTANSATKVYGAPLPALTYTASGFVNGDSAASVLSGSLTTSATAASGVNNNYGITQGSLLSNNNYTINYTAGTLAVTPAPLTVTADPAARLYGQPNPAFAATLSGLVNGDSQASLGGALTYSTPANAASPVGPYQILPGGLTSADYTIAFVAGTLTVGPLTLTAAGATIAPIEGAGFSGVVATFTSPDPRDDPALYTAVIQWGDGRSSAGVVAFDSAADQFTVSGGHTYAASGSVPLNVSVQGPGGSSAAATSTANVSADVLSAAAVPVSSVEGALFSGPVATFTDLAPAAIGGASDFRATIDWGDGTSSTTTASIAYDPATGRYIVSGSHAYAEEGHSPVSVEVQGRGGDVTVVGAADVADAPLAVTVLPINARERAAFAGAVATFTDADPESSPSDESVTIDWGDGRSTAGAFAFDPAAGRYVVSDVHTYAEEGAYSVRVTVVDVGGAVGQASGPATVAATPIAVTNAPIAATAGVPFAGAVATFTDPAGSTGPAAFSAAIDWGDGQSSAGTVRLGPEHGDFVVEGRNTYAVEGVYAVRVTIGDRIEVESVSAGTAVVAPEPASVVAVPVPPNLGRPFTGVLAKVTEAAPSWNPSDFSVSINWGDGTTSPGVLRPNGPGEFLIVGSHTYSGDRDYPVSVTVTEPDGARSTTLVEISIVPPPPVPVVVVPTPTGTFTAGQTSPGPAAVSPIVVPGLPVSVPPVVPGPVVLPSAPPLLPGGLPASLTRGALVSIAGPAAATTSTSSAAPAPAPGAAAAAGNAANSSATTGPAAAALQAAVNAVFEFLSPRVASLLAGPSASSDAVAVRSPLSAAVGPGVRQSALPDALPTRYLWDALDDLGRQLDSGGVEQKVAQVFGTGAVAYVGYVLLNGRWGYLVLSVLSTKPLWSQIDPLDVLLAWEDEKKKTRPRGARDEDEIEDEDEDETLQTLVEANVNSQEEKAGHDETQFGDHQPYHQHPARRARARAHPRPRGRRDQGAKNRL